MKKTLLITLIAAFGLSYSAWAGPCPVGDTLADYISLFPSTGCTVGGINFNGFSYSNPSFGGATAPPASGVDVTPVPSGFGNEVGLEFTAAWLVSSGGGEDSAITFTVSCAPDCTDAELITVGGADGTGSASVAEGSTKPPNLSLFSANSGSDIATFAPVGSFTVNKDIGVVAGTAGDAHMSFVYNLFSTSSTPPPPIPEPSLLLLCSGLVALVPLARRKLRRKVSA